MLSPHPLGHLMFDGVRVPAIAWNFRIATASDGSLWSVGLLDHLGESLGLDPALARGLLRELRMAKDLDEIFAFRARRVPELV